MNLTDLFGLIQIDLLYYYFDIKKSIILKIYFKLNYIFINYFD